MRRLEFVLCFLVLTTLACNLGSQTPALTMQPAPLSAASSITSSASVVLSTLTPTHAATQLMNAAATRRIQFAPGSISGSISGTLLQPQDYLLNAQAGQHMTVSIALVGTGYTDVTGLITDPNGGQTPTSLTPSGVFYDGTLPASGDYTIRVNPSSGKPGASYVLTVVITNSAAAMRPSACPTPVASAGTVGRIKVDPAQVASSGCDYVKVGTQLVVSWPEAPQGATQVTFYFYTQTMSKPDVIGVDSNLADGAVITWTIAGGVGLQGSLYALAEGPAAHSAVWSGAITLVSVPANP